MATNELDFEETLFIINSKTFTTAETMKNARTVKEKLVSFYRLKYPHCDPEQVVASHIVACSTNLEETSKFGVDPAHVFQFWDWVGGRFSVSSAIGVLPLSITYGWDNAEKFL